MSAKSWYLHRLAIDRFHFFRPFSSKNDCTRLLFLTVTDRIAHAQVFPYVYCKETLRSERGIEIRELPLDAFLAGKNPYERAADIVCFQTWFDLTSDQMASILEKLRSAWPNAKLVYLDWFAPTDLRYAAILNDAVDLYVKKQVLADRSQYSKTTVGDTNLADFYARRFDLELPEQKFEVPLDFWHKVWLGPGFETSPDILRASEGRWSAEPRPIDLHARIATGGTEWYAGMREEALKATESLDSRISTKLRGRVGLKEFFAELRQSKICFSPFGYGEICWRDFEAMATGAVLVKPDVGHLSMATNLFRPNETYVPIRWDLSDFDGTIESLLANRVRRETIAQGACRGLRAASAEASVSKLLLSMFERLN